MDDIAQQAQGAQGAQEVEEAQEDIQQRKALVAAVEQRIGPVRPRFAEALACVDRSRHVRELDRHAAWLDAALPLDTPHGFGATAVATISAPHIYVLAFDALDLDRGDCLLELGSGSGYGAALASWVVSGSDQHQGWVTTVEIDPHLAEQTAERTRGLSRVTSTCGDGLARSDLLMTHSKCWLTFAVDAVPESCLERIQEGGALVAPVGLGADQRLLRYARVAGQLDVVDLGGVRFVRARSRIDR